MQDAERIFLYERGLLSLLSDRYRRRPPDLSFPISPPSVLTPSNDSTEPRSLIQLSCRCVCRHFERVDSLVGLPDILGRLLFETALSQGLFHLRTASRALQVFDEAFGGSFAAKLNLSGLDFRSNSFLFATIGSGTWRLSGLTELALNGCHLDAADSDLLARIGRITELRHLSLRSNCLLDESLRSLSAPWRFQRSVAIQTLDLRDNKYLTSKGLQHLLDVSSLRTIVFSASCDLEEDLPLTRCAQLGWRISRTEARRTEVHTEGWIAEVLNSWLRDGVIAFEETASSKAPARLLVLLRKTDVSCVPRPSARLKHRRLNACEAADLAAV